MVKSIFFIGATGYIGATALDRILAADKDTKVTVLVRNPSLIEGFEKVDPRITAVQGSLEDLDKLTQLAAEHDITINTADADGLEAAKAILKGQKKRFEETGVKPVLIHTSGTGTLSDTEAGNAPGDKIYSDYEADDSQSPPWIRVTDLPPSAFHRDVDLAIQQADAEGYVSTYIVLPSTIYGLSENMFAKAKLANPQSQQMPLAIRIAIDRGIPATIGKGANLWPNVHIHDCADLFAIVYRHATTDGSQHGKDGYFFAENGEYKLYDANAEIGRVLKEKGLVKDATPVPLSKEEIDKYTQSTYLGSNSRARAVRGRKLGWKPKYDNKDFIKSLAGDVEYTIRENRFKGKDGKYVFGKGPVLVDGGWRLPN